jgi:hypothetical protein
MFSFLKMLGNKLGSFLSKPEVQKGLKVGATMAASAYAGPAGAKAVEVVGPKILDTVIKVVETDEDPK